MEVASFKVTLLCWYSEKGNVRVFEESLFKISKSLSIYPEPTCWGISEKMSLSGDAMKSYYYVEAKNIISWVSVAKNSNLRIKETSFRGYRRYPYHFRFASSEETSMISPRIRFSNKSCSSFPGIQLQTRFDLIEQSTSQSSSCTQILSLTSPLLESFQA